LSNRATDNELQEETLFKVINPARNPNPKIWQPRRSTKDERTEKAFQEIKALKDELHRENIVLREEVENTSMFEEVVGTSPALQTVLARTAKVETALAQSKGQVSGLSGAAAELGIRYLLWNRGFEPSR
jgi:hypothetical protein